MPIHKSRIFASTALACTLMMAGGSPVQAQAPAYPNGPINFVVPATPGGATDVVARHVAKQLALNWGVPVLVENRAGAGGVIGAKHVIESKPDGRTVLVAPSALGVRTGLDRKLPYDAVRDLAGISLMARTPSYLVVSPALGVNSVAELTKLIKSKKETVMYASAGVGSTGHLHAAMLANAMGFDGTHVPYRGTPEAVNDTVTERVMYVFAPGPNALPFARDGRARVLATTSQAGVEFANGVAPVAPEVLTKDIGDDWYAAFVPAGTPKDIRVKLSSEIARILATPEMKANFTKFGAQPVSSTPDELDAMFKTYVAKARQIGDEAKIKLD